MSDSNRREFLKTVGKGALAAGMFMHLPEGAWLTADDARAATVGDATAERTVECDVLVVGGGFAACFAAIKAREQGAVVVMADKGHAGRSGQSPWAGGTLVFNPKKHKLEDWLSEGNRVSEYLNNRYWTETVISQSYDRYRDLISWGLPITEQDESRTPSVANRSIFSGARFGGRYGDLLYGLRQRAAKSGVNILDRVMITELMKQNGRIVGAIGLTPDSYEMYTFIAKATIMAIGACGYKAPGYPPFYQLTGDGEAMGYRAGAEILGKEFVDTHWTRPDIPLGDATALWRMDEDKIPENLKALRHSSVMSPYKVDASGRRLPDRPAGASQYPLTYLQLEFEAHAGRAPAYGVGRDGSRTELVGGMCLGMSIRNADGLWADDKKCGTSLPGLYAAGDALGNIANGAVYGIGGTSSMGAMVTGTIAGEAAAKEAAQLDKPVVSRDEIQRAKQYVAAPTLRKGGFGPRWVTQLLQNTMTPYFIYFIKKADRLQAALTQVEFMQQHLVPMLIARDPHELRLAHETGSMVLSAEIRLRSALFRTESRGNHYREDFPRRDDKNWLAWTKVKPEHGEMTLVKVPIPKKWWPDLSIPYKQRYPYRYPGE